jgi:putative heme degradation protein
MTPYPNQPTLSPFFQKMLQSISLENDVTYLQMADGNLCLPLKRNWKELLAEFQSMGDLFMVTPSSHGHFFRAVPSLYFERYPGDSGFYDEVLEIDLRTASWSQAFFTEEVKKSGVRYLSIQFFDREQNGVFKILFKEGLSEERLFEFLRRQVDRSFVQEDHDRRCQFKRKSLNTDFQPSLLDVSEVESSWSRMDPFGEDCNHWSSEFLNVPLNFYAIDASMAHPIPQSRLKREIENAFQKHLLVRAILWNKGMIHRMTFRVARFQHCCCGCFIGDAFSEVFAPWKGVEVWKTRHEGGDCLEWVDARYRRIIALRFEK